MAGVSFLAFRPGLAPAHDAPLVMDAALSPNRSLSGLGFFVVLCAVFVAVVGLSALYLALGAWPVVGFLGLDVLLVLGAFWLSYRQGRALEIVRVSPGRLTVERRSPGGQARHLAIDPWRVRLDVVRPGKHDVAVVLRSGGDAVRIAAALSPAEREAFAAALKGALRAAQEPGGQGERSAPQSGDRPVPTPSDP